MSFDPETRQSALEILFGNYPKPEVDHTCSCGSKSHHVFMRYKSKVIMRFKCKGCGKAFERNGDDTREIDLMAMWEDAIQRVK